MSKEVPQKITQTTRDGHTVTLYPSRGGIQLSIQPNTDKYIKQDAKDGK